MAKALERVIEPWERQPDESTKAFEAFIIYRDMGADRSIRRVGQRLVKSGSLISDWSAKYSWKERSLAWDDEQDRIAREKQSKKILEMREKHADLAVSILDKAAEALLKLNTEDMSAIDIARMVEVGSRLERLSRGETTDRVENKTEVSGGIGITIIDDIRGNNDG